MENFGEKINNDKYQIFIFCCPAYFPVSFAKHSWLVLNKKGLISRYEIRHYKDKRNNKFLHVNAQPPFQGINVTFFLKNFFWKAKPLNYIEGGENSDVQRAIELVENSEKNYPYCSEYFLLGPNSNTYVQWVLHNFPDFKINLGRSFIGRNFKRIIVHKAD